MQTSLVKKLLAYGHLGILQPKITLVKGSFHIVLGCYCKQDHQQRTSTIETVSDNLSMYHQTQFIRACTSRYIKYIIHS